MSKNNYSYPYPVLTAYGDDVLPALDPVNVVVDEIQTNEKNDYILHIHYKMENESLTHYIKEDKAEFMVEINCSSTLYRRCERSRSCDVEIILPRKQVAGEVVFRSFIIAKTPFTYYNENFHPDYNGDQFEIELGDVLAIFNEFKYDFAINYSQLKAFSSIMHIRKAEDANQKEIQYLSDEPKIVVVMPQDKFEQYNLFKADPQYSAAVHASLAQNALLAVMLQENWNEVEDDRLWKRTIHYRVNHEEELMPYRDFSTESIIQLSHKLLGDPIKRMFEGFANSTQQEE